MPYGQEGRAGIVYRLLSPGAGGQALKVFKPRFRLPYLVSQAEKLSVYADLPGLQAARRTVLTPQRHPDLLRQHPDLTYAVLMPWIEGPTWLEIVLDKKPFSAKQSIALARNLADVLSLLEQQGLAHCDLSGPNVMLPVLAGGEGIALIDLEGLYSPGMIQPQALSSGSAGYAHQQASGGLWGPEADRFAGAVLLAEMLGWCDPKVCQAAWGESYFEAREMQQEGEWYRILITSLRHQWGDGVAALFERAWMSDSLADCPTFGEWLVALPESVEQVTARPEPTTQPAEIQPVTVEPVVQETPMAEATAPAQVETVREVRAFMQAVRLAEEHGNLNSAWELCHKAWELAITDPNLSSLSNEITLMINEFDIRRRGIQEMPPDFPQPFPVPPSTSNLQQVETNSTDKSYSKKRWLLPTSIGGIIILLCLLGGIVWGIVGAYQRLNSPLVQPSNTPKVFYPTKTVPIISTPVLTNTLRPTDILPTVFSTRTPILTNTPSCPGAKYPTRIKPNKEARVCTKSDRLIMRENAGTDASEIFSLYTGTQFFVLEGPKCADKFWWWKIEIYPGTVYGLQNRAGTWTTSEMVYGWVREGWDDKDAYFICQP